MSAPFRGRSGPLALVALVACAGLVDAPHGPSAVATEASLGYVFVTLPTGMERAALVLRSKGDGRVHQLERRDDPGANAFGAWLPEGEYEIAR